MSARACLFFGVFAMLFTAAALAEEGRIYGKIYTDRGDVLEGPIRWDKNEASWDDMIDGYKEPTDRAERHKRHKYDEDKGTQIDVFGLTIFKSGGSWGTTRQAAIQFGEIQRLTPTSGSAAELLLKSGRKVELSCGSTDLGDAVREIVIETEDEGELELDWDDIDYIEFMDGGDVKSDFGNRLFGTVTTSRGGEFTGWICWDMDEMFDGDIIDGRDRDRKRKIKLSQIAKIEKISSQASRIILKNGDEIRLDDSNDVDSGNRGIIVSDPKMGRVIVEWDEFEDLTLKQPTKDDYVQYGDYDGGQPLYGSVYDEDGDEYTGYILWDNDEEYTWEVLDGDYRGVAFDIPFTYIKSIEKLSRRTSRVTLWDGRQFKLRDSNDVDDDNNGIFVTSTPEGEPETSLDWDEFERVEFKKK